MAEDLSVIIETNATGPKQVTVDGMTAQQHSLPDQIEADKYLASKTTAAANPAKGLIRMKIVPPGAV